MDPHSFEEDIGSIFRCDIIFTGCDDGHVQKSFNDQKYTVIALLGGWKARHVIH
jgi:hypothetical protein